MTHSPENTLAKVVTTGTATDSNTAGVDSAKRAILGNPYLTGEQVTNMLRGGPTPHDLARLRRQGSILGLKFAQRGYLYPSFQFDAAATRVFPLVVKVNRMITRNHSVADAILWWLRPSGTKSTPLQLAISESTESLLDLARHPSPSK